MMNDRQLIEMGAQALAARHGFADWKDMRQRDLEYLCDRIEERSGILISLSTIKRIMGGQYNRLPQTATLNAISVYLGYADWQAFRATKMVDAGITERGQSETTNWGISETANGAANGATKEATNVGKTKMAGEASAFKAGRKRRFSRQEIVAAVFVFGVILLLSWDFFAASSVRTGSRVTFSVRKTTQNNVPNTVVFTYDLHGVAGDSFFIQQSWDRNRRVRIDKNSHTLTDIYYEPGFHVAKLIADDRIIKTVDVSIPTDNWFFCSKEMLFKGQPDYIQTDSPIRNGILGLDRQTLVANRIDPEKPQVYLASLFPAVIGADADNFRLTARIRMKELRNTGCPFIMPEVFCQHGFTYCIFTTPGCTGEVSAEFGDQLLSGRHNDLSWLGLDVRRWHRLDVVNRQRRVTVSIDGKPVVTKDYTASAGLITGLGFHSNGLVEADSIRLAGLDGKVVYSLLK
jgi:hypothetical protein